MPSLRDGEDIGRRAYCYGYAEHAKHIIYVFLCVAAPDQGIDAAKYG
jgi:hypothetical protein